MPAANTLKHLSAAEQDEFAYYKFEPAEWQYEMQGAEKEFDEICEDLRNELDKNENNDEWFYGFQKQVFNTCIEVLEKLKNENFFKNIVGKDIFLTFSVSDFDMETEALQNIITRLNDYQYKTEYFNWMKTWGK